MNERLYLQNFIDLLSEKYGMDKKDADKFVKEFFLLIEEALEQDRSVFRMVHYVILLISHFLILKR